MSIYGKWVVCVCVVALGATGGLPARAGAGTPSLPGEGYEQPQKADSPPEQPDKEQPGGKGKDDLGHTPPEDAKPALSSPKANEGLGEDKVPPVLIPNMPEWAFDACWYYVMVSRFSNGSKDNDPAGTRTWTEEWPSLQDVTTPAELEALSARSYGGDLQGLQAKLPYLKGLGINALCLTPVFAAGSDDKYQTIDYRHIDDSFGVKGSLAKLVGEEADRKTWEWSASDRVFLDFLKKAHETGFHVIIDGAFTSVGVEFWAWKDVLQSGKDSRYASWFDVADFGPPPSWTGPDGPNGARISLKRSRTGLAPMAENHLFGVLRRWMDPNGDGDPSDGVDGWRLDNVAEVGEGFWQRWRGIAKQINPNALIVGELWQTPNAWLEGDQLHTVLNYGMGGATRRYFALDAGAYTTSRFMAELEGMRRPLDRDTNLAMLNLLGSPDTERILTRLTRSKPKPLPDKGDAPGATGSLPARGVPDDTGGQAASGTPVSAQPKARGSAEADLDRWRMAAVFKAFYIGAPVTYYGEEVGMTGSSSKLARAPMWWPTSEVASDPRAERTAFPPGYRRGFIELTKLLHTMRKTHEPLRRGECRTLLADDERRLIAFSRYLPGNEMVVLMNCSQTKQRAQLKVGTPGELVGVLTPQLRLRSPNDKKFYLTGGRYPVSEAGLVDLPIDPMTVRLIVVRD